MATQVIYNGDGVQNTFNITFPYRTKAEIEVTVNGAAAPFTWGSPTAVIITTVPPALSRIKIARKTPFTTVDVDYNDGAVLTENDLDTSQGQLFQRIQEISDDASNLTYRAVLAPEGAAGVVLPSAASRANQIFMFNGAGEYQGAAFSAFKGDKGDPGGDATQVGTASQLSLLTVPLSVQRITTTGFSSSGDGGAATYARVNSVPSHPGYLLDASGAVFVIQGPSVRVEAFGAVGNFVAVFNASYGLVSSNEASAFDNRTAIRNALKVLSAKAVSELTFNPNASYWLGDYTGVAQTSVFGVSDTAGLTGRITGNNARLVVRGAVSIIHDIFLIHSGANLVFDNIGFIDLAGHNANATAPKGTRGITLYGGGGIGGLGTAMSGITLRNTYFQGMLGTFTVLTANSASALRVTGIRFEGTNTAVTSYYGPVFAEDGDDVQGSFTTFNAIRSYFPYGVRNHDVSIAVSHDGIAPGSNGQIKIIRKERDTLGIRVKAVFSGSVQAFVPVSIEHQNGSTGNIAIPGGDPITNPVIAQFDGISLDLTFPDTVQAGIGSAAVKLSAMNSSGTDLTTPLNEEGSGGNISPVTTRQRFGSITINIAASQYGTKPFVEASVVPLDPGSIRLTVPARYSADAVKLSGFQVNGYYLSEVTGNMNSASFTVPLYLYRGNRFVVEFELYVQSDKAFSGKQHSATYSVDGNVNTSGGTTGTSSFVTVANRMAPGTSDLTLSSAGWGYRDRMYFGTNSAADFLASTSYARMKARVIARPGALT